MKYLLMLYGEEKNDFVPGTAEFDEMMSGYGAFTQEVMSNGMFQGGEALSPVSTATTVRVRDGKSMITDGPFAETKEQIGGYYLLECKDLEQALAYAAKIPAAKTGSVEVRPVMDYSGS